MSTTISENISRKALNVAYKGYKDGSVEFFGDNVQAMTGYDEALLPAMTEGKISFKLKNNLSELNTLLQNLENFYVQLGLSKRCKYEIDLVSEELFTNIISYGYTDDAEHWIETTISFEHGTLIMCIEDDGIPFNPLEAESPDLDSSLEERCIGGLGVHFAKHFTKDVVYERCGNKNILTLKKVIL